MLFSIILSISLRIWIDILIQERLVFAIIRYVPLCQYTDILFYNIVLVARVWQVKKKFKFTFFGKSVLYRIMIYLLSLFLKCLLNLKLSNSKQCNQFFFLRRLYMYLVKYSTIRYRRWYIFLYCVLSTLLWFAHSSSKHTWLVKNPDRALIPEIVVFWSAMEKWVFCRLVKTKNFAEFLSIFS